MGDFKARCVLLDTDTNEKSEVTVESIEDIVNIIGDGIKDSIRQIDITKYHKVYYNNSAKLLKNGVSGWINGLMRYDDSLGSYIESDFKEYFVGNKLLLVLCDDKFPVDMNEDDLNLIMSCINL